MTIKIKPNSDLSLNQAILLEHYYLHGISHNPRLHDYCYDYKSGTYKRATYLGLSRKQLIRARSFLVRKGYITEKSYYDCHLTEKGIKAVEQNEYIHHGWKPPLPDMKKPPIGSLSSYIWAALRTKKMATMEELLSFVPAAEREDKKVLKTTRRMLFWLCKARIVRKLPSKKTGSQKTVFKNKFKKTVIFKNMLKHSF